MLRRGLRALRTMLLVLGTLLFLWLPLSWFYRFQVISPWPFDQSVLVVQDLVIYVHVDRQLSGGELPQRLAIRVDPVAARAYASWPPRFTRDRMPGWVYEEAVVPMWLLGGLCLIWPMVSMIRGRRGDRRGFPVEPKGGGETVSTPVK